ncbi:MAG TPA: DUF2807 domain-containing protein [Gammaproteobacteria bacterium]|nr:DUF2807 domain-containing protein [Gammaproteobacteria bacterium]
MLKIRVLSCLLLASVFSEGWASTTTDLVIEGTARVKIGHEKAGKNIPSSVLMEKEGNRLTIKGDNRDPDRWYDVTLSAKQLSGVKTITLKDQASLTAKGYSLKQAVLNTSTSGTVDLNGDLDFKAINQSGSGKVRIHWLKGKDVSIEVNSGQLILAGKVDTVRLKVYKMADVNARHLTAKRIWVYSEEEGFAKVNPSKNFFVFSHGVSAVEAYTKPEFRSILSYDRSSVIYPNPKPRTYQLRNRKLKRELRV